MTPQQWAGMSWHARRRWLAQSRTSAIRETIPDMARRIADRLPRDPDVAAHLAAMDHYTSTPRRRSA